MSLTTLEIIGTIKITIIITIQLIKLNRKDTTWWKQLIVGWLVSVAEYLMNVCMMARNYLENLDKIVKNILKNEGFYGKQTIDDELCTKRW